MLNNTETKLHQAALRCSRIDKLNQTELIQILIAAERSRYYRKLGRRTLEAYIIEDLDTDSTYTYQLSLVVAAALKFAPLAEALESGRLRIGHASRILAKLTEANVSEWIDFASTHTFAEIGERVACSNEAKPTRESKKRLANNQTRLSLVVDNSLLAELERVQALIAQRGKPAKIKDALAELCGDYLTRHDPVEKAKRSQKRAPAQKLTLKKIVRTYPLYISWR